MSTTYSVLVDGADVTSAFHPLLISLSVKLDDQHTADSAEFELDDTGGQIVLPRNGASIVVVIDGAQVFVGTVDTSKSGGGAKASSGEGGSEGGGSMHSAGSRSKGRTLTMSAKSADMTSKIKEKQQGHKDNATLNDAAQEWGSKAGVAVKIDAGLAAIQRPYWAIGNESFMAWGARTAVEIGATFKVFNGTAVFVPRTGGTSASGVALPAVTVTWGDNLITWSASPVKSRPEYGQFRCRWYDPVKAMWQVETSGETGPGKAVHMHPFKKASKDDAQRQCDANKAEGDREQGGADSVTTIGDVTAQPSAPCILAGIRDGVDGVYLISSVTHTLNRSAGFVTELGLKQPKGSAGTDDRKSN